MTICDSAIRLCATRVTRLDSLGNPDSGPNNVYVSNKPLSLGVTPDVLAGDRRNVIGGCDCVVATHRTPDRLLGFNFEFDVAALEFGMLEMMLGASVILGGSDDSPIGIWWPEQVSCDNEPPPMVCLEGWQYAWDNNHQDSTFPFVHWVWPGTRWQIGPHTLNVEFLQPRVTGYLEPNENWGLGIFDDLPESCPTNGGVFYDTDIPTAECDYQTQAIT